MRYSLLHEPSESPIAINLTLGVKNFGPVTEGVIDLKPLTIFIGPNISGKSYMAMLIHSIFSLTNRLDSYRVLVQRDQEIFKYMKDELGKIIEQNKDKDEFVIPETIIKKIYSVINQNTFSKEFQSLIGNNFGSPVSSLIRTGQKHAEIALTYNKIQHDIKIIQNVKSKSCMNNHMKYKICVSEEHGHPLLHAEDDGEYTTFTITKNLHKRLLNRLVEELYYEISGHILQSIHINSFYFPAGRTGILQSHKVLSASIIRSAHFGEIEPIYAPKLPKVLSEFISNILPMTNKPGPFKKLAEELEGELLHGHINLPVGNAPSEITYGSNNGKIPLHRASSTISEIAPLSLYMKYIIGKNDLLIIEEPEAHLHPENQLILAKYIVKMIRQGLNVLITTHSVFLLEQLSKYMEVKEIAPEVRKNQLHFDVNDYLSPEEVSPYVFKKTDNGHYIEPVEMDDEGISQEEFIKVNELLYQESISIQKNRPDGL